MGVKKVPGQSHQISHSQSGGVRSGGGKVRHHRETAKIAFPIQAGASGNFESTGTNERKFDIKLPAQVPLRSIESQLQGLGFSFDATDLLTKENFRTLANYSFAKMRPYSFALAYIDNPSGAGEKKIVFDASVYLTPIDEDKFHFPADFPIGSGKVLYLNEITFFVMRENQAPERVGAIENILRGPNSTIKRALICQEESDALRSTGWITDALISASYYLGIGVRKDSEYAEKLLSKLDDYARKTASPELFFVASESGTDSNFARFLLDHGFDPTLKDPNDGKTSIEIALRQGNTKILQLFSDYGFQAT